MKPENVPNDDPTGNRPGLAGGALATSRVDLFAPFLGAAVAVVLGLFTPLGPLGAALAAGPVVGLANRVYNAELVTGAVAETVGAVTLALVGGGTTLLALEWGAALLTAAVSPFVGLVAGGIAIPFGRARDRFGEGRRGR